jgi:hypothetical protein
MVTVLAPQLAGVVVENATGHAADLPGPPGMHMACLPGRCPRQSCYKAETVWYVDLILTHPVWCSRHRRSAPVILWWCSTAVADGGG